MDFREARIHRLQGDREKADQIGVNQRGHAAGEQQSGLEAPGGAQPVGEQVVEPAHGHQDADGDDRAGQRIAQTGQPVRGGDPGRARKSRGIREQQRECDRQDRGQRREEEAVAHQFAEAQRKHHRRALGREQSESHRRHEKSEQHRERAGERGGGCTAAVQLGAQRDRARRHILIARVAAIGALEREQQHDEPEQRQRQLSRGCEIGERQPRIVDAGGERLYREIGNRGEIRECFHQRKRHPGGDAGPGERQRDADETSPGAAAEQPPGFDQVCRLCDKGGAREQVDVRIQDQREHRDRAGSRTHLGEPVFTRLPARQRTQRTLHGPRELQQVRITVCDDVGRHRERKDQCPIEQA